MKYKYIVDFIRSDSESVDCDSLEHAKGLARGLAGRVYVTPWYTAVRQDDTRVEVISCYHTLRILREDPQCEQAVATITRVVR